MTVYVSIVLMRSVTDLSVSKMLLALEFFLQIDFTSPDLTLE